MRIASGYAPGGPNPVVPGAPNAVPTSFGPETIVNYEAGVKASLLDRHLTVTLDGFYIDWRAIQLGTTIFANGSNYFVDENGGKAASRGGELAASYNPLPGLSLTAAGAFVNASLTKDAPGVGGLSGDRLARVPQVNAALGATYKWEVKPGLKAFVGANWRYNGDEYTDYSDVSSRVLLPSYNVLDVRAGVDYGPVECVFFIKNLNNSDGITNLAIVDPRGAGYAAASLIQPRTFGLTLTARY